MLIQRTQKATPLISDVLGGYAAENRGADFVQRRDWAIKASGHFNRIRMSIFDLLKAKWHNNPDVRKAAISKINRQSTLLEIAKYDSSPDVRIAAIERLNFDIDRYLLYDIARDEDSSPDVRIAAYEKITDTYLNLTKEVSRQKDYPNILEYLYRRLMQKEDYLDAYYVIKHGYIYCGGRYEPRIIATLYLRLFSFLYPPATKERISEFEGEMINRLNSLRVKEWDESVEVNKIKFAHQEFILDNSTHFHTRATLELWLHEIIDGVSPDGEGEAINECESKMLNKLHSMVPSVSTIYVSDRSYKGCVEREIFYKDYPDFG